jgi:hypothetical protein
MTSALRASRGWAAATVVSLVLVAAAPDACAQELEPRAYVNTPTGVNFLIVGYGYSQGGVVTDASVPVEDAEIRVHGVFLAYARSLDFWGRSGKFDVVLPYASVSGTGEVSGASREREVSGLGDAKLRVSMNLYGAPALSLQEFADYTPDVIIGASLQVSVPLGQYDSEKLINVGTNRWSVKPELGVSKAWGRWTTELAASVILFTANHDFLGGKTRAQDPIYSLQGHVIYGFQSGIWMAVDGTYYAGGRTTIDGVKSNDLQANTRVGVTLALPVDRHQSVKLYASHGVSTRIGSNFTVVGIAWQFRWGGGI